MEKEINIAEILRDKPRGIKLYSPIFGEVKYDSVLLGDINVLYSYTDRHFYMDGKFSMNGECLLFPSKEMRDWDKFAWKKGDILVSNDGNKNIIFIKFTDDTYTHFKGKHLCENSVLTSMYAESRTMNYGLATYSKCTYINLIEKTLGGKLNPETLEIEPVKSKHVFKPLEYVLSNDNEDNEWTLCQFSHFDKEGNAVFVGGNYADKGKVILHYEGNEHLLGTTNSLE